MSIHLGVDIGGTGIKAALVDTRTGKLATERRRMSTPEDTRPTSLAAAVREMVESFDHEGPIGCCFPAVIKQGRAWTAGNIDERWIGTHVGQTFQRATGHAFTVLNDADAAAVAEMRMGAGRNLRGTVLMITLGTGIGSGLFYNGQLIPNLELGWMPYDLHTPMERHASNRVRKEEDLDWETWGGRVDHFLKKTVRVLMPDHILLSGGVSKKFEHYRSFIDIDVPIHIAHFRNNAGIIGAALQVADG